MLSQRAKESGLMIFAGAGISMIPPSALPNWYQFNDAVLTALAKEVSSYTREDLGKWIFSELVTRRNQERSRFAPDYMADVIAEEVGMDYLRVVQALDAEETNACHHALAAMAKAGAVQVVVTTNFDRLLERAFDNEGVPYQVYATPSEFAELNAPALGARDKVPIMKVHGTVDDLESMVDTLSQRLVGRPDDLENALAELFKKHHILFVGFSGADLDYDPDYLGLRSAAQANRGFTFLLREGDEPRESVKELSSVWGDDASFVKGILPNWLSDLARQFNVSTEGWPDIVPTVDRLNDINNRAAEWAKTLGRLQNVNILSSLLRASGHDETAGRLFWGVWKFYREPEDLEGPIYARFNHLLGRLLLEYGFNLESLRPSGSFGASIGTPTIDKDEIDDAFQYLARASYENSRAAGDLAVCYALMGDTREALRIIEEVFEAAVENEHRMMFIDAAVSGGLIWSIAGYWSRGLPYLERARDLAIKLGMESRRARLCAHLVRFLAWQQRYDDASERFHEGIRIAGRLGMESLEWELRTAWGYALTRQRRAIEAVPLLSDACDYFQGSGRNAMLTRASLDLYDAATLAPDETVFNRAKELLRETEKGYSPLVYVLGAEAALHFKDFTHGWEILEMLKRAGAECGNDWALEVAAAFDEAFREREQET